MNTSNNRICCAVTHARRSSGRRHAFFKRLSSSHPKSSREPEVHPVLRQRRSLIGRRVLKRHQGDTVFEPTPHHLPTHTSSSLRLVRCSYLGFVTVLHSREVPPHNRLNKRHASFSNKWPLIFIFFFFFFASPHQQTPPASLPSASVSAH